MVADVGDDDAGVAALGHREHIVEVPRDLPGGLKVRRNLPAGRNGEFGRQKAGLDLAADFKLVLGDLPRLLDFRLEPRIFHGVPRRQAGPPQQENQQRPDHRYEQVALQ